MGILKKFSLKTLIGRFGLSFKRFPIAMLLTLLLGCYLIYLNHGGSLGYMKDFFWVFYPATGAVLAVALSLITEDFKNWKLALPVQLVVHAAWLAVSVYLSRFDRFSTTQLIAVSATIAAMSLSVFVACFYRKRQDVQFWNYSMRTVLALAMSTAIGGILTVGLNLFLESLKMLFGLQVDDNLFGDIAAVCMTMLAPALFMNIIPKGRNKYVDTVVEFSRFSKGVVQYLFIPLLVLYMVTLYVYAAQILFQWKLPVGGVSYMVTVSMVLMILLIYITYPIQHLGDALVAGGDATAAGVDDSGHRPSIERLWHHGEPSLPAGVQCVVLCGVPVADFHAQQAHLDYSYLVCHHPVAYLGGPTKHC